MPDKAISDLTAATQVTVADLFVLEQNNTAKKLTGQTLINDLATALDGHGGISNISYTSPVAPSLDGTMTITMADTTTYTVTVTNGNGISSITQYWAVSVYNYAVPTTWYTTQQTMTNINRYLWSYTHIVLDDETEIDTTPQVIGVYGDTGQAWYVHIRYASRNPIADSDMGTTPDAWIGVYSGTSNLAPSSRTSYTWYQWKGDRGLTGNGIASVLKTSTSGLVDTYTVTFTDGNTTTFNVTNGSNISSIAKTATSGLVDTYTVTLTNGNTSQFSVTNAKSIVSVDWTSNSGGAAQGAAGTYDTYTISYNTGDTSTFSVYNGANGAGAVSSVDGINAVGTDVPLLTIGNGAPTTATQGNIKSRYFDALNSVLYICTAYDSDTGTYTWRGAGVSVDSALSSSSTNPVQNKIITNKVGTTALNTTATNLSDAVNELVSDIGNMSLDTSASNLTAAVNEVLSQLVESIPASVAADLNTIDPTVQQLLKFDSTTLNTPYTAGLTQSSAGVVLSYSNSSDGNYCSQFALPCGSTVGFVRAKNGGTWGSWTRFGGTGQKIIPSTDIDSIDETGFYITTGTVATLIHINWDGNYAFQIGNFFSDGNSVVFRQKSNNTWSPWASVTSETLYLTSVSCSATTGNFVSYNASRITAAHVVVSCEFANPSAIASDFTWTTSAGLLTLNGTCSTATTANIVLVKQSN